MMQPGDQDGPLNVLILEDNDDDAALILRALQRGGLKVSWRRAHSRETFLETLDDGLDIILADYAMPQFNALQALDLLAAKSLDIPLIIISGTIGEEAAVKGLRHGAVDYLLKDRLGRLQSAIRGALREKALRSQTKQAISALRQSEARYRKMVEESLQGIVIVQNKRTVFCNEAYAQIMGYSVDEVLAMTPQETLALVHPADQERLLSLNQLRMSGAPTPSRYEFRCIRRDGAVRWLDAYITATDFQGAPAVQAYYVDVTARKQAEEAAREQQARQRVEEILAAIGEGVVVLDRQGRIIQMNPAFTQQTGYFDELIGDTNFAALCLAMEDEVDAAAFLQDILATLARDHSWRGQARVRRRNGSAFDAAMTITPLRDEQGADRELVVSIRDISQIKEVERMKDAIISIAAHELRTPLTTIGLYSEALATRSLPPAQRRRFVDTIHDQSQQLGKIIEDMLDLARLEAGRGLQIAPEPVDLGALVTAVVEPFAEMNPSHSFDLSGMHLEQSVYGDPLRLMQVLRNLIGNAVKYSPEGGPIAIQGHDASDTVHISISDQGIGMTPQEQEHLFEKFYRANSDSRVRGTGLGLAICRLIVEGHGGRIWAQSTPGVGSTFTFTIPTAPAAS